MDLEKLKNTWKQLDGRIARLEAETLATAQRVVSEKVMGSQQRLVRSLRTNALLGLTMPFLGVLMLKVLICPVWIAVVYGLFGIVMAAIGFSFAGYIRKVDFLGIPVVEALAMADRIARMRRDILILSVSMGIVVVGLLMYACYLTGIIESIWGCVAGVIIGGIAGIIKLRHQNSLIRSIKANLHPDKPNDC